MTSHYARIPLAGLALVLAACGTGGSRDDAPTIRSLERSERPAGDRIRAESSRPVEASPELALDNYRKLLELSADGDTRAEALRRMADLQVQLTDTDPDPADQSRLREAVALYEGLLRDRPNDPGNDRVLYQLARAQQSLAETEAAIGTLQTLLDRFPRSPYAADGRFRRAEMLFGARRYDEAASEYEGVIALRGQTPFFEAAQYKYAWTLYRLARYNDGIEVMFTILDRELPAGEPTDPEAALAEVPTETRDMARDVLRLTSLSYTALGGGPAINASLADRGAPRFYPLVYRALGEFLLERERYSDAAESYAAFIQRYPDHDRAPAFQESVIASYQQGDFPELVIREKQRYVETYDPRASYWAGRTPGDELLSDLRGHVGDLSSYFHSRAQTTPRELEWPTANADYLTAAGWYERTLAMFPNAEDAPEVNFLFAETLLAGGETLNAAQQFHRTAYEYPTHGRSAEAGYAAVLAYYDVAEASTDDAARNGAIRTAVDEGIRFADSFADHPQRLAVLTRAAEDLYALEVYDDAIGIASRVLNDPAAAPTLVASALGVRADAEFTLGRYRDAETSYIDLLAMEAQGSAESDRVAEQLALSIYRQGEASVEAGDRGAAVAQFLRIGQVTPNASVRAGAEYDAAILLTEMEDWAGAARVLEGFRTRYPADPLAADADKQLANAYENAGDAAAAADAYTRIAGRSSETREIREESAWKAATLYDESNMSGRAATAYADYMDDFNPVNERATQARQRLIALNEGRNPQAHQRWLQQAVAAGRASNSDGATQLLAARSSLTLGRMAAEEAAQIALRQPLRDSLSKRREKISAAAEQLRLAAGFGFEDITPDATHSLGKLYHDLARDLLDSERPRGLGGAERDEYTLLLEDQAFPIEEQAIEIYESNLKRIPDGVWNDAVRQSWQALITLVPARFERRPMLEERYESLR